MTKQQQINDLVEYLNKCRYFYYVENNSPIPDEKYDKLFDDLKRLEDETGIILSNSPTQNVGYTVLSNLEKVEHYKPLLSLDKAKDIEAVEKFRNGKDIVLMHKLDGLTCQLTYVDGRLVRAETRGDGYTGEDITHNARTFIGVPSKIRVKGTVRITGEAIIHKDDFVYINSTLEEPYKNPRNLASGSVRQLNSGICAKRFVRFVVWNANDLSTNGYMTSGLEAARELGFNVVTYIPYLTNAIKSIKDAIQLLKVKADNDYVPIDGIVAMYDDIAYGESLGSTAHHYRNGLAYKFYDDGYNTTLNDIDFTIGKTGVLTPTAVFDAVDIDGTTVTRASVHNISILAQLNLAKDDYIEVYKANEIIPQVRYNLTKHSNADEYMQFVPKQCPYCSSETELVTNDGVVVLKCTNEHCVGKMVKKFASFTSKNGMNIDGLSEKTIDKLVRLNYIKKYSDIYKFIDIHYDSLCGLSGFGKKSVDALKESIERSKQTTLSRLLCALNIDGIGKSVAEIIANNLDNNPNNLLGVDFYLLCSTIKGLGDAVAKSLNDWFSDSDNVAEYMELCDILDFNETVKETSLLTGMKFVITGKLSCSRCEIIDTIKRNGGTVSNSVSSETTHLINNDINSNSAKNKKAKELNIRIITEEMFMDMLKTKSLVKLLDIGKQPKQNLSKPKTRKSLF